MPHVGRCSAWCPPAGAWRWSRSDARFIAITRLPADGTIAFANPFATGPAPYRIHTPDAIHYAICGWDALGVLAALGSDGVVQGRCPDCAEPIVLRIREGALDAADAVAHFLVPAVKTKNKRSSSLLQRKRGLPPLVARWSSTSGGPCILTMTRA